MNLVETRPLRFGPELGVARHESSFLFFFVRLTSDADGRVSGSLEYDVFGKVVTETGIFVSTSGGMSALVFGYAGKPYDPVTGLSDYGFRDYAPTLARFTTADPIRDGSNWYAYCNSDPVNYVDMWGERPLTQQEKDDFINTVGTDYRGPNIDLDIIEIEDRKPTVAEVRSAAQSVGVTISETDQAIQNMIDNSVAISLPNNTIYVPYDPTLSAEQEVAYKNHEIDHQYTYQIYDPKQVFEDLCTEAKMQGQVQYDYDRNVTNLTDIPTWEGQAQYVQDYSEDKLKGNPVDCYKAMH